MLLSVFKFLETIICPDERVASIDFDYTMLLFATVLKIDFVGAMLNATKKT